MAVEPEGMALLDVDVVVEVDEVIVAAKVIEMPSRKVTVNKTPAPPKRDAISTNFAPNHRLTTRPAVLHRRRLDEQHRLHPRYATQEHPFFCLARRYNEPNHGE